MARSTCLASADRPQTTADRWARTPADSKAIPIVPQYEARGNAIMQYAIGILIGLIVGAGGALVAIQLIAKNVLAKARAEAEQLKANSLSQAQNKAKEIELSAKQEH